MVSIYWLIAFVILVVIEIATLALTTIWFAGGAIAAFFISLLGFRIEVQLTVFLLVSFLLLFFTRPLAAKYLNRKTTKTNADSLIGKHALITKAVDNIQGTGNAVVNGQEWTVQALEEGQIYAEGALVWIREIRGVKLIVSHVQGEIV